MEIEFRLEEIGNTAKLVLAAVEGRSVLAFYGEMGAGKTTFIHALCKLLGVKGTLSSPTFSIINEYESSEGILYHIDLYRCANEEEAIRAGVEECLYSGHTCFVEWPSRAEQLFPPGTIYLRITENQEGKRRITLADKGNRESNN